MGETHDPRAVEALIAALKDTDSKVRASAAEALGRIADPRAVEPLMDAMKDPDLSVRALSRYAPLGEIKDPRPVELLITDLSVSSTLDREKYGYSTRAILVTLARVRAFDLPR